MANKAYQFRIYPTEEQKFLFAKTFGCVRLVYNYYLEQKIKLYSNENRLPAFVGGSPRLYRRGRMSPV